MYAVVNVFQKHHDFCFDQKQTIVVGLLKASDGSDQGAAK